MFVNIDYLRELNLTSLILRLFLAALFGGVLGLNGTRKRRAAGFRTYMLVCMGAALTMIISQYCVVLPDVLRRSLNENVEITIDVARLSAQVLSGIGFLGAGSIIVTGTQEVKGLTTAACLWTSACMGIAVGAGFYECVVAGFFLVLICIFVLSTVETWMVEHSKNINIYVEFRDSRGLSALISHIKKRDILIYDIDLERGKDNSAIRPSAVIMMHMNKPIHHSELVAKLADYTGVYSIKEI